MKPCFSGRARTGQAKIPLPLCSSYMQSNLVVTAECISSNDLLHWLDRQTDRRAGGEETSRQTRQSSAANPCLTCEDL